MMAAPPIKSNPFNTLSNSLVAFCRTSSTLSSRCYFITSNFFLHSLTILSLRMSVLTYFLICISYSIKNGCAPAKKYYAAVWCLVCSDFLRAGFTSLRLTSSIHCLIQFSYFSYLSCRVALYLIYSFYQCLKLSRRHIINNIIPSLCIIIPYTDSFVIHGHRTW